MKLLFDFFPVIIFFTVYMLTGQNIYYATAVIIPVTILQVLFFWLKNKKIDSVLLVNCILVTFFGGITLLFHHDIYIKLKITILSWLYATLLLGSQPFKKTLLELYMSSHLKLPSKIWSNINLMCGFYFVVLGGVNLYVLLHFPTAIWVKFKLFGVLGLTFLFYIALSFYLAKYLETTEHKLS
jgi:intracellular septation protein